MVKVIRNEKGGEYFNHEQQCCSNRGKEEQLTPAYTPQLNGKA